VVEKAIYRATGTSKAKNSRFQFQDPTLGERATVRHISIPLSLASGEEGQKPAPCEIEVSGMASPLSRKAALLGRGLRWRRCRSGR
jgi:hypothetical protein